jgi:hypothetical protein
MYEEESEHARKHEEFRGTATNLFVALIAGLLAFAVGEHNSALRQWTSGILICGASVLGAIVSYKHYERYKFHHCCPVNS